jgi:hypothetical protein
LKYFPLDPAALPWETQRRNKADFPLHEGTDMTFEQLTDFLKNKMRLSHIYQPLLIRSLVDAGGSATLRQLASSFLAQDESQLLYYEKRIKEMPLKVLSKHGVVETALAAGCQLPHSCRIQGDACQGGKVGTSVTC